MGRILAVGAVLTGAYALWAGQHPGQAFRHPMPGALFAPSGTPGPNVGAAAVAAARRIGN